MTDQKIEPTQGSNGRCFGLQQLLANSIENLAHGRRIKMHITLICKKISYK